MDQTSHIPQGHVFFREGTEGGVAFLIISGKVEISRTVGDKKITLALLQKGEIFGEMALLGSQTRTATATAVEPCEVVAISRAKLLSVFRQTVPFVKLLCLSLIKRLKETNERLRPDSASNTYTSICQILALMAYLPRTPRHEPPPPLDYATVLEEVKHILDISTKDCRSVLEKLRNLGLIRIEPDRDNQLLIYLDAPRDEFLNKSRGLFAELDGILPDMQSQQLEFIDVATLAELADTRPAKVLRKIAQKEIPEDLFYFRKKDILEWLQEKGTTFFERPDAGKGVGQLDTLEELAFVDDNTLQMALGVLEPYKVCILLKQASREVRQKVFSNLSYRLAHVVQQELDLIEHVDPDEVEQVEAEILEQLRGMGTAGQAATAA